MKADVLDRAALRRAFRGCEMVFHAAGLVASRPPERVWQVNALAPRMAVEAAAAEGVRRVVVTSSVAGIGPAPPDRPGTEEDVYRGWGLGLTYPDAKHEGESEALAAGARLGVEVVVVNPSYVFGAPVDRSQPGETSTRMIGNYLRGRLPAVVDARDQRRRRARRGQGPPARRRARAGRASATCSAATTSRWVELLERVAELSGVHHPLVVLPPEAGAARAAERSAAQPGAAEGIVADGPELALLVGEGAPRARLPRPLARPDPARHDRLVPRAARRRLRRRPRRCRWRRRACGWPGGSGCCGGAGGGRALRRPPAGGCGR